jgi:hypothetical protein
MVLINCASEDDLLAMASPTQAISSSSSEVVLRCGETGDIYNSETEQCCGTKKYVYETHFCQNGAILFFCDFEICCAGKRYNEETQFCWEDSKIGEFCGYTWDKKDEKERDKHIYDPDRFQCSSKL